MFAVNGNSTASGGGATTVSLSLPSGLTVNSSVAGAGDVGNFGAVQTYGITTAAVYDYTTQAINGTTSDTVRFVKVGSGTAYSAADLNVARSVQLEGLLSIPIAEWAGSGTVQLAQNDVEFASNDGSAGVAANTAYTTGMVYGPSGSNFVAVASTTTNASTDYLVRFQTPVQNTDLIQIEAQDGTGTWNLISNYSASPIRTYQNQANSYYGLGWYRHPTVNTDIYVQFGNMGSGPNTTVSTAYAAAGNTWSGFTGRKWRVRKSSAGAAVGFGIVSPGVSSGLVSASGLPGNTTGNAIASGYVGETIGTSSAGTGGYFVTTNTTTVPTTVGASTLCSVTLNIGNYLCTFYCRTIGSTHQLFAGVNIGGTIALAVGGYSAVVSTYDAVFSVTLPIVITANSTAVTISGYYIGTVPTAAVNKIGVVRIA